MPLIGEAFTRFSRSAETRDGDECGRWIACDESGYDGEQLRHGGRYLVYASVAVDDVEAGEIVQELRAETRILQAPELKFGRLFGGARWCQRREALRRLWEPGGALHGRCAVYVVDKEYAAVAKIIDLLLEEHAYENGEDLYAAREARRLAWVLALQGRRALRAEGFERLLDAFIAFASQRAVGNEQDATAVFFAELDKAWAASTRREVTDLLLRLRGTRPHGDVLHVDAGPIPLLEMLVPSVAQVARLWSARLRESVSVLSDEHNSLTDGHLDILSGQLRSVTGATPASRIPAIRLRELVRGSSIDHPSIQLADLLAGAGAAVANRHAGVDSPAADDLWRTVVPLIEDESLVPYESAEKFAKAAAAPR